MTRHQTVLSCLTKVLVITSCCLYLAFTPSLAEAKWFNTSHAPSKKNRSQQTQQPKVTLQTEWTQPLDGRTVAGAASNSTHAFAATESGQLYAFNAKTGKPTWQVDVGEPVTTTPLASDLLVIIGTRHGTLAAYHAHNGSLAWKQTPSAEPYKGQGIQGLASTNNLLATLYEDGSVFVWDKHNGKPIWHAPLQQPCKASPLFHDEHLFTVTMEGQVTAFQATTGDIKWTHSVDGPIFAQASWWDGKLLIPSATGALFALNAQTGDFLWSYTERQGKPLMGKPGIIEDTLLIGSLADRLGVVNGKHGFRTGEARLNGGTESAIITVGDLAIVQTTQGRIIAVDADGEIKAQLIIPHYLKASPTEQPGAISQSSTRLFTTGQDGSLTAIRMSVPLSQTKR